ncbi:MAG TPA: ROK family protein [Acidobacteriota bacterium]|nr:ROK family protein [Acidobacteriota bacterium]
MKTSWTKKEHDKAVLLAAVRQFGPLSRVGLHRLTRWRPSTISTLVRELLNEGKLREAGTSNNPLGRKQILLTINECYGFIAAVELDSERVIAAAMDLTPTILDIVSQPACVDAGIDGLIEQVIHCASQVIERQKKTGRKLLGIGFADTGLIDSHSGVSVTSSLTEFWQNVPLKKLFEEKFQVEFLLESNTRAKTVAERILGAGEMADDMVYIDYGVGIGAGIFAGGRLLRGATETAGEIGHTQVMENGPSCKCGSFGCLEALASSAAIAARARKAIREGSFSKALALSGDIDSICGWTVLEAARAGDKLCTSLLEDAESHLGLAIANLVNLFNPQVVVLSKRLELAGDGLADRIARIVRRQALPHATMNLAFRMGKLGDEAGVLGAGLLVLEKLYQIPAIRPPRFLKPDFRGAALARASEVL